MGKTSQALLIILLTTYRSGTPRHSGKLIYHNYRWKCRFQLYFHDKFLQFLFWFEFWLLSHSAKPHIKLMWLAKSRFNRDPIWPLMSTEEMGPQSISSATCYILAHIQAGYGWTYLTCCNKMISNKEYFQKCCLCVVSSTCILASRNQTSYPMCHAYSCQHYWN